MNLRTAAAFVPVLATAGAVSAQSVWKQTTRRTRGVISLWLLLFIATCGGPDSTLYAQAAGRNGGWARMEDPAEHAFALDVPRGWTWRGGAYRLGYGDIRVMVDVWSPDGKTNVRYGDVWYAQSYALPNQYHREGEEQDLGALGRGIYAGYRTGQQFAELYARQTFRGVCRTLTPQRPELPSVQDTSVHREGNSQSSVGEVSYRCETSQGLRIAYVAAKTTLTTSRPFADLPPTTGWTPELVSYLVSPDEVPVATSIAPHIPESFKVNPRWQQFQDENGPAGNRLRDRPGSTQDHAAASAVRILYSTHERPVEPLSTEPGTQPSKF
jgi:hypothetical protein